MSRYRAGKSSTISSSVGRFRSANVSLVEKLQAYGSTITLPTITGTHTDFPLLLKTEDFPVDALSGINRLANGGGNLRIYTDSTKATRLPIEVVELVTGASPSAIVWVKVPSVFTGATVYIEADTVETSQPAVTDTYGRNAVWSDYAYCSHDGSVDSTGNLTPSLTNITSSAGVFGNTGGASSFNGVNSHIAMTLSPTQRNPVVISAWFNPANLNKAQTIGSDYGFLRCEGFGITSSNKLRSEIWSSGTPLTYQVDSPDVSQNTWQFGHFRAVTSTSNAVYLDNTKGVLKTFTTRPISLDDFRWGDNSYTAPISGRFDGLLSEMKIRTLDTNDDWIKTEYENQSTTNYTSNDGWSTTTSSAALKVNQLPKHYHSDFKDKSKQPVGQVEIDWSNPLTNGLQAFILQKGNEQIDLVTGFFPDSSSGTSSNQPKNNAIARYYNSGSDFYRTTSDMDSVSEYTFLVKFNADNYSSWFWSGFFAKTSDLSIANSFQTYRNYSGGGMLVFQHGSTNTDAPNLTTELNAGGTHTFSASWKDSTIKTYKDGEQLDSRSMSTSPTSGTGRIRVFSNRDTGSSIGDHYHTIVFNRGLSQGEIKSLSENPYQLLKPSRPAVYYSTVSESGMVISVTPAVMNTDYSGYQADINTPYSVVSTTVNTGYSTLTSTIELGGSIDVSASLFNSDYTSLNTTIAVGADIDVIPSTTNTDYTSLSATVNLYGSVDVTANLVNTDYVTYSAFVTNESVTVECICSLEGVILDSIGLNGIIAGDIAVETVIDNSDTALIGAINNSDIGLEGELCHCA